MKIIAVAFFSLCLFEVINSYCIRPCCETCTLEPIGPDMGTPCRVVTTCGCPNICQQPTTICTNVCQCGVSACECCSDIARPCDVCATKVSNICSCDCECALIKAAFNFPEVEYPMSVSEIQPLYCGSCWSC